jgi:hypothetical protein
MKLPSVLSVGAQLVTQAGWAPAFVFLLHVFISRVVNGYILYHRWTSDALLRGVAMAYFLSSCFAALPEGTIAAALRPVAAAVFVVSLTATASVVWEFAEFTSDALFATRATGAGRHTTGHGVGRCRRCVVCVYGLAAGNRRFRAAPAVTDGAE